MLLLAINFAKWIQLNKLLLVHKETVSIEFAEKKRSSINTLK